MPSQPPDVLRLIHAAMLAGVGVFLALTLSLAPASAGQATPLRWAWLAVTVAVVFGVGFLRGRLARHDDPARVRATALLVWALCEASAFVGMACTWVTGDPVPAVGATLVAAFLFVHHRPSTFP